MPRVKIGPALPDRSVLNGLRAHWHSVFRRRPPPQLPRHLLYRVAVNRFVDKPAYEILQGQAVTSLADGRNIRLINTFANEEYERFNNNAADLAQQKVDLIYAVTLPAALAAQRAT